MRIEASTPVADPWGEPIGRFDLGATVFPVAMVTGHRPNYLTPPEVAWSQVALHHTAWRLRSVYGTQVAISGMALGADTWWALAALAAGMRLHAYVPFEEQAAAWPEGDQAMWQAISNKASRVNVIDQRRGLGRTQIVKALHARNDAMLVATEHAQGIVVALFKEGETGGTASVVKKARKAGQPLLILDPRREKITREGW